MCVIEYWKKNRSKIDAWDMGLVKLGMVVFGFWLLAIIPSLMNWVNSVNAWYLLAAFVIIIARPCYRYYIK